MGSLGFFLYFGFCQLHHVDGAVFLSFFLYFFVCFFFFALLGKPFSALKVTHTSPWYSNHPVSLFFFYFGAQNRLLFQKSRKTSRVWNQKCKKRACESIGLQHPFSAFKTFEKKRLCAHLNLCLVPALFFLFCVSFLRFSLQLAAVMTTDSAPLVSLHILCGMRDANESQTVLRRRRARSVYGRLREGFSAQFSAAGGCSLLFFFFFKVAPARGRGHRQRRRVGSCCPGRRSLFHVGRPLP